MVFQVESIGSQIQQDAYRNTIFPILAQIRRSQTGEIVLNTIDASPRRVRIVPYGRRDVEDAATLGLNSLNDAYTQALNPMGAGNRSSTRRAGGSGSEIHFSMALMTNPTLVQSRPDEILLHEMCHALRQIMGAERYGSNGDPLPIASFGDIEEFFAAMVTSVYSSENGRPPLGNHGNWPLPSPAVLHRPPFSTRLREFRSNMPALIARLAAVQTGFNPFRDVQ